MADQRLYEHLRSFFGGHVIDREHFDRGPIAERIPGFTILVVRPKAAEDGWRYISDGARDVAIHGDRYEYLIEAPFQGEVHLETLSMVANFHAKQRFGGVHLGRILDVGKPWMKGATCDHLLVSLPHSLGPEFEIMTGNPPTRILWLLPITKREADFAHAEGVDSLEQLFERVEIDTLDPTRRSAV